MDRDEPVQARIRHRRTHARAARGELLGGEIML